MNVNNVSNWGSLTPSEILAYYEEGVKIPGEYLEWAEKVGGEYSHTYDETVYNLISTAGEINEADEYCQKLEAEGISLKELAMTFKNESNNQKAQLIQSEGTLNGLSTIGENTLNVIASQSKTDAAKLQELQAKLDEANKRLASATTDEEKAEAQKEVSSISGQISTLTSTYKAFVDGKTNVFRLVAKAVLSVFDMAINSKEVGDETVDIATRLNKHAGDKFNKQAAIGASIGVSIGVLAGATLGLGAVAFLGIIGIGAGAVIGSLFSGKNYVTAQQTYFAGFSLNIVSEQTKSNAQESAKENSSRSQEAQKLDDFADYTVIEENSTEDSSDTTETTLTDDSNIMIDNYVEDEDSKENKENKKK